jgi:hypothetical protein
MQETPQSQLVQAPTQQQCHLPIVKIQRLTKTNIISNATKQAKWRDQHLEDTMDTMEKGHFFLRKASRYKNIPLISLSYHLHGRTRSRKVGPQGVLTKQEDATIVTWVLNMQIIRLSITM